MKKPSVGRVVLYHQRYRVGWPEEHNPLITYAAIVTGTSDNTAVSLCVFKNGDTPKGRADTEHIHGAAFSSEPRAGFWSWPEE